MKSLKRKIELLGMDYRKEMSIFFIFVVLFIGAIGLTYVVAKNKIILLIPSVLFLLFIFGFFMRYDRYLRAFDKAREEEFIHLFTYFGIYINNGYNVYNSLQKIKAFATDSLELHLDKLIQDIDNDKSVTPYVNFASNFSNLQIKEVMLSIYQMVDEGEGGAYISQYQHLFGKLSEEKHAANKYKRIERLKNLSIFPLMGSAITLLSLTLLISDITGGQLSGL